MTTKKKTAPKKKETSIWETLSMIDCSEHIEKKGGFNYLSWAWAWGILMEEYPEATFFNHLNTDGYPCFFDVNGNAMVRVTLTILEQSHTEDYPVLNYKNQAIKDPDSFAVNTALKRCLVKSAAYFGLAHYIYAGEDTPPKEATIVKVATPSQVNEIETLKGMMTDGNDFVNKCLSKAGVDTLADLTTEQAAKMVAHFTKAIGGLHV